MVQPDKSSTGLDSKVVGLLCYLGVFITGIIFLVVEKESRYVKFHAMQSIIVFGAIFVINFILGFIPFIGWLLGMVLTVISFILWIVLMIMTLQGNTYKVPYLGDIAEQQARKL